MNFRPQKIIIWPMCLIFLIGITFAGDRNVLCIGDNGLVKFEALCLPCCGEAEKTGEADLPGKLHNESDEYSNCSDIDLYGLLWSKRFQKTDSNQLGQFASEPTINAHLNLTSAKNDSSRIIKFYLAFGQSPLSYFITTIVFRC